MTAPFRFVHCADVHLDTPFPFREAALRQRLAQAERDSFRRVVDLCLAEKVSALLVAGDLFDAERLTFATEDFLVAQLQRLEQAGIATLVAAGNHDPGAPGGRSATLPWPASVTRFTGSEPEEVVLRDAAGAPLARVVGAGHLRGDVTTDLAAAFPAASADVPTVGLLHALVADAENAALHPCRAPTTRKALAALGYAYIALGHVHRRQALSGAGAATHYSGTLCAHAPHETGAHGALLVTLSPKGAARVEFRELAALRCETLRPALDQAATLDAVRTAIAADFAARRATATQPDTLWLLAVELAGPCPCAADLSRAELREELAADLLELTGAVSVDVTDAGVTRPADLVELRALPDLLGTTLTLVDELQRDRDRLEQIAPAELAALSEGQDKRAWLGELLAGIGAQAADTLLTETDR